MIYLFILLLCFCRVRIEEICLGLAVTYIKVEHSLYQACFGKYIIIPVSIKGYIVSQQTKFNYPDKFSRLFEVIFDMCWTKPFQIYICKFELSDIRSYHFIKKKELNRLAQIYSLMFLFLNQDLPMTFRNSCYSLSSLFLFKANFLSTSNCPPNSCSKPTNAKRFKFNSQYVASYCF